MRDTADAAYGPFMINSVYFPPPASDPDAQAAKHRLADELRSLIEAVVTVDAAQSGTAALAEITRTVATARTAIESLPRLAYDQSSHGTAENAQVERGPYAGRANPIASPLHLARDGQATTGWAVWGHAHEGGVGDMHGGVIAGAFDDLLGCAQLVSPVAGRTGTLTIRYRYPSPIGKRIDYHAEVERFEGYKVFCRGTAHHGATLLAEAEAVFITPRDRRRT